VSEGPEAQQTFPVLFARGRRSGRRGLAKATAVMEAIAVATPRLRPLLVVLLLLCRGHRETLARAPLAPDFSARSHPVD